MIDGDGNVRITDFGIATAAADTEPRLRRHAAVHGARAARGPPGVDQERHLRARLDPVRDFHRPPRLRSEDTSPSSRQLTRAGRSRRRRRSSATWIRRSSASFCAASSAIRSAGRRRRWRWRPRCPAAIRWRPRSRPAKRRRPTCWPPPAETGALDVRWGVAGAGDRSRRLAAVRRIVGAHLDHRARAARQGTGRSHRSRRPDPFVARIPGAPADRAHGFITADDYINGFATRGRRQTAGIRSSGGVPSAVLFWYRSSPASDGAVGAVAGRARQSADDDHQHAAGRARHPRPAAGIPLGAAAKVEAAADSGDPAMARAVRSGRLADDSVFVSAAAMDAVGLRRHSNGLGRSAARTAGSDCAGRGRRLSGQAGVFLHRRSLDSSRRGRIPNRCPTPRGWSTPWSSHVSWSC